MDRNPDPFVRNADGMIDFDRYRSNATLLRRLAMQDTTRLRASFKLVVIVVLMLGAIAVAPSHQDANARCRDCATVEVATDPVASALAARRSTRTVLPEKPPLF